MNTVPAPVVTTISRSEWTGIWARRWDYLPDEERKAHYRRKLNRRRLERLRASRIAGDP